MAYLKTNVRFIIRNPGVAPRSRNEFRPLRDERPLERSFMTARPGSEMSVSRPGAPSRALHYEFREGTDMDSVSSADYTALEGQGGASEYFLNNINLDTTTTGHLYDMVNVMINVLQETTTLLDGKTIIKMYAADRAQGTDKDAFYQSMIRGDAVPLRTLVDPIVGRPGVPTIPLVIIVELDEVRGGSRKSKRKTKRKSLHKN
jgi:hypothetical protein